MEKMFLNWRTKILAFHSDLDAPMCVWIEFSPSVLIWTSPCLSIAHIGVTSVSLLSKNVWTLCGARGAIPSGEYIYMACLAQYVLRSRHS